MPNFIKQIVVLSGKGGTGKTTVSAALARLLPNKIVVDCDVEAANLHLTLKSVIERKYDFFGGKKAFIQKEKCVQCGICKSICRFNAIKEFSVNQLECEGCGFCFHACSEKAITFSFVKTGECYQCILIDGSKFYYARLDPGETNSGKLVSELKKRATKCMDDNIEWIIVDGAPGIGCPVTASLAGANYALIITEPSKSALHDLKRLVQLLKLLKLPAGIFINKSNLNLELLERIENYSIKEKLQIVGRLPFDENIVDALRQGKTIIEIDDHYNNIVLKTVEKIENQLYSFENNLVEI